MRELARLRCDIEELQSASFLEKAAKAEAVLETALEALDAIDERLKRLEETNGIG